MTATVLDTLTGTTHTDSRASVYDWMDGNWSCDCNRYPPHIESDSANVCEGAHRFIVTHAQFDRYETPATLRELNCDYPEELLTQHGITDTPQQP